MKTPVLNVVFFILALSVFGLGLSLMVYQPTPEEIQAQQEDDRRRAEEWRIFRKQRWEYNIGERLEYPKQPSGHDRFVD